MTEVGGLTKWQRQVGRIPGTVKTAIQESQAKNAEKLSNSIRAFVPVKRGDLARSVNWSRGLPPSTLATGAFRLKQKDLTFRQSALDETGLLVCVYAGNDNAYYARWVEFGTKATPGRAYTQTRSEYARGEKVRMKRAHAKTRAQPFFYPVIRAYSLKIKRSTASAGNRALKKALIA